MSISTPASAIPEALPGIAFVRSRPRTLWRDAWVRLQRNKAAMVSLGFIILLLLIALLAPVLAPYPYDKVNFGQITKPPSAQHWLGMDSLETRCPE